MPPAHAIEGVLLDAGGVLLLPDPAALRRAVAGFGVEPDDETCRRAHYHGMAELDRVGFPDWSLVDRVVARAAGVDPAAADQAASLIQDVYLRQPWVPAPRVVEGLRSLHAAGFRLAVVSNAGGTMERQLADHRICATDGSGPAPVSVVVDSHLVGIEKPDPAIFNLALEALHLEASRCLFVGDSVHFDVNGARAAGMQPVHLDPYGLCRGDHPHTGSVADLAGTLARGGGGAEGSSGLPEGRSGTWAAAEAGRAEQPEQV